MRKFIANAAATLGIAIILVPFVCLTWAVVVPVRSPEELARQLEMEQHNARPAWPMTREQMNKWLEEAGPVTCM